MSNYFNYFTRSKVIKLTLILNLQLRFERKFTAMLDGFVIIFFKDFQNNSIIRNIILNILLMNYTLV